MEDLNKKIHVEDPVYQTELEIEVLGCFSLPESWKPNDLDVIEYGYQVNILGIQVNNGKPRKRELTEEEIKAAEEAKKNKKEVPKKKGQELEVDNQEEKKKAEELTRRGSQSSRYDDESAFYMNKEDLFKNSCITWENETANDSRLIKSYSVTSQIEEMKMLELLDHIEDSGLYLELSRIPKNVEEDAKKKPGKGKQQEEAKTSNYKAWVDLSNFKGYGISEQHIRAKLEDIDGEDVSNSKTYISLRLKFNTPLFPTPVAHKTTPQDLIPTKPPPPKFLPSKDGSHDFQRQIKLACKAIAAEYHNAYTDQLSDTSTPIQKQKENKDLRRDDFLYSFNTSGKSQILKNKLRKSVVKICRERYKTINSIKGLSFNEKDKIFSEIYAYLLSKMQESIAELAQEKRETLHEEPVLPQTLAEQEKQERVSDILNESYDSKLKRLALEYEIIGDYKRAIKYYNERTQRYPLEKIVWLDFTRFSIRQGNLNDSEKYISEAISISGEDSSRDDYMLAACIYLSKKKYLEALVFFNALLSANHTDIYAVLLTSFIYKHLKKPHLEKFYIAQGKRLVMKHLGIPGCKNSEIHSLQGVKLRYEEGKGITTEILDDLNFMLVDYLLSEKLADLARSVLEKVVNKDSCLAKYLYCTAEIEYWSQNYEKSAESLKELLNLDPRYGLGWTLKGNSYYNDKKYSEAQECYLKAIRYSKTNNISQLIKLGNIYIINQAWTGAKLLFSKCCDDEPSSISWQGLGIACLNLSELDVAEKALTQANIMNDENPYTWGALAYLCLKQTREPPGRYYQFRQCLTQALKLGLADSFLLANIGHEYLRKFFLKGTGPNSQRLDPSEVKLIYTRARKLGQEYSKLELEISKEFEAIINQGDNKLDLKLLENIETAKQEILKVIRE